MRGFNFGPILSDSMPIFLSGNNRPLIIHGQEIIFVYVFQITRSITDDKKPNTGWDKKPNIVGHHYVRSITYGGNLIASLKFTAKTEKDKKDLAIKVEATVKAKTFGVGLGGQFKQLAESVKDISTLSISFKATAPLVTVPTDIDSLVQAIEDFPKSVSLIHKRGVTYALHWVCKRFAALKFAGGYPTWQVLDTLIMKAISRFIYI